MNVKNGKDLTKEAPRSPRARIGGYSILARMADKCRATINGHEGEYHFNCPLDNMLFGFKEVSGEEVRTVLEAGGTDEQLARWFNNHGTPKTAIQVAEWSDSVDAISYSTNEDPEKREWFAGECKRLGLDPKKTTLFEMLEKDDRESFQITARAA